MSTPIPSVIANRYRIIKEIGRGGMGAVYLVRHLNTGDYLAMKLIHEQALGHADAVERFKREMRLPAKIRSDHIVKITDADAAPELNGAPFLVMELLNGCDLSRVLEKYGSRSKEEVIWVLSQIVKALDKAHSLGIIHRDLKPENLFIHRREDESLTVKILDFGIAKITEDIRRTTIRDSDSLKSTGTVGTPLYMAPEQAQGQSPGAPAIGPGTDIWALGMMVYELLTGQTYLSGNDAMELITQLLFSEIEAPSKRTKQLPAAFDAWFLKACDRDPSKRWATTSAQLTALTVALGIPAPPASAPTALADAINKITPPTTVSYGFTTSPPRPASPEQLNAALASTQPAPSAKEPSDQPRSALEPRRAYASAPDTIPEGQLTPNAGATPASRHPGIADAAKPPVQRAIVAVAIATLLTLTTGVLYFRACSSAGRPASAPVDRPPK